MNLNFKLQSWKELVEAHATTACDFSIFLHGSTYKMAEMLSLPPPLTQCCVEGLTIHHHFLAAKQH